MLVYAVYFDKVKLSFSHYASPELPIPSRVFLESFWSKEFGSEKACHITNGTLNDKLSSIIDVAHDFIWGSFGGENVENSCTVAAREKTHHFLGIDSEQMNTALKELALIANAADLAFESERVSRIYNLESSMVLLCIANKRMLWDVVRNAFEFSPESQICKHLIYRKQLSFMNFYQLTELDRVALESIF